MFPQILLLHLIFNNLVYGNLFYSIPRHGANFVIPNNEEQSTVNTTTTSDEVETLCLRMHNNTAFMGAKPFARIAVSSASECRSYCIEAYPKCSAIMFYYLQRLDNINHVCYMFEKNSVDKDVVLVPEKPVKKTDKVRALEIVTDCHQFDPFPPLFAAFINSTDRVPKRKREIGFQRTIEVTGPWSAWSGCSARAKRQVRSQPCEYGRNIQRRRCSPSFSAPIHSGPVINIIISYPPMPYQHPSVHTEEYAQLTRQHQDQVQKSCCYWKQTLSDPTVALGLQPKVQVQHGASSVAMCRCDGLDREQAQAGYQQQQQPSSPYQLPGSSSIHQQPSYSQPSSTYSESQSSYLPPTPTYPEAQPGYSQPTPAYTQPQSGQAQPTSGYAQPGYYQPNLAYLQPCYPQPSSSYPQGQPQPAWGCPDPMHTQTQPAHPETKPTYPELRPTSLQPRPTSPQPRPTSLQPRPTHPQLQPTQPTQPTTPCESEYEEPEETYPPPTHAPIIPVWSIWSDWSTCTAQCGTGTEQRYRTCETQLCDGVAIESRACASISPCSTWASWTEWSHCSVTCGAGERTRSRYCTLGNGRCDGNDFEVDTCTSEQLCSQWNSWESWSQCSATCGVGSRRRLRSCYGGNCLGQSHEEGSCKVSECSEWAPWQVWSACSVTCGRGTITRERICLGHECKGASFEEDECNQPICSSWAEWGHWSGCSATCGFGISKSERMCIGSNCPGKGVDEQSCNYASCPVWSQWEPWTQCSVSCGSGGVQTRSRICNTGDDCEGNGEETQYCSGESESCAEWSQWGSWSSCNQQCGTGQKTRNRECINDAYGATCYGPNSENTMCLERPCCEWTDWAVWTPCSHNCGQGMSSRTRMCLRLGSGPGEELVCSGQCHGLSRDDKMCNEDYPCATRAPLPVYRPKPCRIRPQLTQPRPEPNYQPPQPTQQPTQSSYQPPQPSYQSPQPIYQPLQPSYQPPQLSYQPPQPAYQPPQPAYQPPQPAYQPPQPAYQPPQPVYQPLQSSYQPPQPAYQQQEHVYQQPDRVYQPSNQQTIHYHSQPAQPAGSSYKVQPFYPLFTPAVPDPTKPGFSSGCNWTEWFDWNSCPDNCGQNMTQRSRSCVGVEGCVCYGQAVEESDCMVPMACKA